MKRNLLYTLMGLCLVFSLVLCRKKADCPGFTDTVLPSWFPYSDNQKLIFRDTSNVRDTFTLKNTLTTAPYSATGSNGSAPRCNAEKFFASVEKDSSNVPDFSLQLHVTNVDGIETKDALLTLKRKSVYFADLRDTGFSYVLIDNKNTVREHFATLSLGNQNFTNVISAMRDTSADHTNGIYKVYYSKTLGIAAWAEYPSGRLWVKQ